MRHPIRKICLSALLVFLFNLTSFISPAANRAPQTILDYYFLLPHNYLSFLSADSRETRRAAIFEQDTERGYLQVRPQQGETYTALALYQRADGSDVLAIERKICTVGCAGTLSFLEYGAEGWNDVTRQTLPSIDANEVRAALNEKVMGKNGEPLPSQPRLLYTLSEAGASIEVSEFWSGMLLGRLEWVNDRFIYQPGARAAEAADETVLAAASNPDGDSIRIIGISPGASARLPIKGHLRVKIAYELKSARAALIWANPIVEEKRLPDYFTSGSMFVKRGSGVTYRYLGINNLAQLKRLKVIMADESHQNLLTLNYDVDAQWQGVLECPTIYTFCFTDSPGSSLPIGCTAYPSGLGPGQQLVYNWTLSGGTIKSGQGTHHIEIDTAGRDDVTVSLEVEGFPAQCENKAMFHSTPVTVSRPSR